MLRRLLVAFAVLGAAGCVQVVPNPYSHPEVERSRLLCLASGGVWIESADAYQCRHRGVEEGPRGT